MNCASCNTPLNGSNTCPNCGALNMAFGNVNPVPAQPQQVMNVGTTPVQPQVIQNEQPVMVDAFNQQPVMQPQVQTLVLDNAPTVNNPQVIESLVMVEDVPAMDVPAVAQSNSVVIQDDSMMVQEESAFNESVVVQDDSVMVNGMSPVDALLNEVSQPSNDVLIQDDTAIDAYVDPGEPTMNLIPDVGDNDDNEIRVTATMAPPTLNIQDEQDFISGVGSISNAEVSTYSPEEMVQQNNEENVQRRRNADAVNIAIPSVSGPVEQVTAEVMDGGVPDVVMDAPTAGDGDGIIEGNESTNVVSETNPDDGKKKGILSLNLKEIKRTKSLPLPIALIAGVMLLIMGLVIGSTLLGTKSYTPGSFRPSSVDTSKLPRVADGKNNVTKAGQHTYKIPADYYYDNVKGGVSIYDKNDTFRIYVTSIVGIYNDLATAKTSVLKTLEEQKITVGDYKETKINKRNYVIIQGTTKTINRMIAFTDAGNDYIFYIEIVTKDNVYNQDLVAVADDIVKNATFNDKISSMEMIDVYHIGDVVVKASEEYKKLNK